MNGTDKLQAAEKAGSISLLALILMQLAQMNGNLEMLVRLLMERGL